MAESATGLTDLPKVAFESFRDEYRDLTETWRHLDTKAQGLGAIAGIFLAAVFAWARDLPPELDNFEKMTVALITLLLGTTVLMAVLALQLRNVLAAPMGEETEQMVRDIVDKVVAGEQAQSERIANFYFDQIMAWRGANEDTRSHLTHKAGYLRIGQMLLLLASGLAAVWTLATILDAY